jgi:chromosome partitioning protein
LEQGQSIFVGNIKGGVGKSTLTSLLFDYFMKKRGERKVQMVDADRQGTSFELLAPLASGDNIRHVPVSDRFDGLSLVTLDSILRRMRSNPDTLTIVDTGAGWPGNVWQIAMLCECIIIPTTLSWADLRPTIEFVREMDERKQSLDTVNPHLIIVPNKVPPSQRDMSMLSENLKDLNVVVAPPLSDLSVVRHMSAEFKGLEPAKGTRFYDEFTRLGDFINDYVLSGRLNQMYDAQIYDTKP